jgi:hypothetical protein
VEGDENLSRIYGFILYTEAEPYVAKVLRDEDFWKALNNISGSNWPIFAAKPLKTGHLKTSSGRPGHTGFMVQTWEEPNANKSILMDFGLNDSQELPLFVAFMWDDNDNLNEITIKIEGRDTDSIYHSLEEIVKVVARVEAAILPEYKGTENVFRNVKTELEALRFKHTMINRGKIIKKFVDIFSVFV